MAKRKKRIAVSISSARGRLFELADLVRQGGDDTVVVFEQRGSKDVALVRESRLEYLEARVPELEKSPKKPFKVRGSLSWPEPRNSRRCCGKSGTSGIRRPRWQMSPRSHRYTRADVVVLGRAEARPQARNIFSIGERTSGDLRAGSRFLEVAEAMRRGVFRAPAFAVGNRFWGRSKFIAVDLTLRSSSRPSRCMPFRNAAIG